MWSLANHPIILMVKTKINQFYILSFFHFNMFGNGRQHVPLSFWASFQSADKNARSETKPF